MSVLKSESENLSRLSSVQRKQSVDMTGVSCLELAGGLRSTRGHLVADTRAAQFGESS